MNAKNNQPTFPYVPYPSFKAFISYLHDTALPEQIDHTMMPSSFSGGTRAAVMSALKSLGLIDTQSNTTQKLKNLVTAFNSNEWPAKVEECVLSAYDGVAQDINLKLKSASRKQAEKMFEGTTAQMRNKCIRFFLSANKDAGIEYSPHLKLRKKSVTPRKRTGKTAPKRKTTFKGKNESQEKITNYEQTPSNMFDLPLPIASGSFIRVPSDITVAQVPLVKAAVEYLEAMAKQNEESKQ